MRPGADEQALTLVYRPSAGKGRLEVIDGDGETAAFELPLADPGRFDTVEYTVLSGETEEIAGFRLAAEENGPGEVISVQLGTDPRRVSITENSLSATGSWKAVESGGETIIRGNSMPEILEIAYDYYPDSAEELEKGIEIAFGPQSGEMQSFTAYLKRGGHRLFLFPWLKGDTAGPAPVRYRIEVPPSGFTSLTVKPGTLPSALSLPVPADMSAIRYYPGEAWRRGDFELFSWNLFPDILVFDTRNYEVQASFFKRLAFYVEKKGYTGQLLPDSDLEGKHGWNAHDYRSIDLASFFQAAADRRFELNENEILLKEILLKNNIIAYDEADKLYLPKKGGLISISRSSSDYLRGLFLTHEGMHGIFFTSPAYRERCFEVWDSLPPELQLYWKRFFRWMSYDTDNLYLVVNELQAYLLQQRTADAEYYFRNHRSVPGLRADAVSGETIRTLLNSPQTPFQDAAEQVRGELYETTGLWHDRFFCLELSAK